MGPHVLTASFSLRHLTPTWRYDGSQQDASEYLTALFRGLSSFPISRPWETKDPETGSTLDRGSSSSAPDSSRAGHGETSGPARCLVRYSGTYCTEWPTEFSKFSNSRGCALRRGSQASLYAFRAVPTDQHTAVDSCRSGGIASGLGSVLHISHRRWTTQWTLPRARTMAAHLSRLQNQTCDRLAMEVTYCWCVPFFRTSLLLAPLDLCTYGYGVPLRPGPPASLAGGVFYWLCGTDLFAQQGAERLLFRYQGRTSFCPFCHSHGGHHVAEVGAC